MLKRRWWTLAVIVLLANLPLQTGTFQAQTPDSATAGGSSAADDEVFRSIDLLIRSRRFHDAERLLEDRLSASLPPASGYFRMGKLYFDHQEWSRSVLFFQRSLRLASQNDQAHLLLGLAWRQLKRPDDAESELLAAASLNPGSDLNAYLAGHQLLLDEKYEAALGYLYKAVALNPHDAAALRALGMDQARLGNYGLAEVYYKSAIEAAGQNASEVSAAFVSVVAVSVAAVSVFEVPVAAVSDESTGSPPAVSVGLTVTTRLLRSAGRSELKDRFANPVS